MKFSMNGFRKQLSTDIEELKGTIESFLSDDYYLPDLREDLINQFNQIATHSNVINCVFDDSNPDFQDICHIEIELIEPEKAA